MRASWRSVLGIAVAGRWVLTLTPPASAGQGDAAPQCDGAPAPWLDRHKSSDERVQLVLAQLTLDERIQELGSIRDATHARETPPIARLCVPALAMGGGGGSSHVLALYTVSPVDGIRNRVGPDVTVTYAPGADAASIPAAVDAAKAADVAVVMVGDNEAEGRDRPSMTLSAPRTTWSRRWPRPTRGTKAAQGATVAYLAAALLALLSIAGFVHALVTPRTRAFAVPEAVSAAA